MPLALVANSMHHDSASSHGPRELHDAWRRPRKVPHQPEVGQSEITVDQARDAMRQSICEHLQSGKPGLLVVSEAPGAGKTVEQKTCEFTHNGRVIRQETRVWKWTTLSVALQLALSDTVGTAVYQVGRLF